MRILNTNTNINFGKTAVATCVVKETATKKEVPATIYKMDPQNESDYKEIRYSKNTKCIQGSIERERKNPTYNNAREFYLLKADKNGEVISCAQTLHRFRAGNIQHQGLSTRLEEASENKKFDNGAFPLVAYLAQRANDRYDKSIISVTGTDEPSTLQKKLKFKELDTKGVFALSKRRFTNYINKAKNETKLEILV